MGEAEVVEVIDSWEDLESNTDEGTQLPRTIEFPTISNVIPNVKEVEEKLETLSIIENPIQLKLENLDGTLKSIEDIFAAKPEVRKNEIEKMEVREVKQEKLKTVKPKSDSTSKSAEEIKAEREEKKKAKAAAKEMASAKKTENAEEKLTVDSKTPE